MPRPRYTPAAVPHAASPRLEAWLADEFRRIAAELSAAAYIEPRGRAPEKTENGMIVYAVDPWATDDFSGVEGFYGFENGAWVKL